MVASTYDLRSEDGTAGGYYAAVQAAAQVVTRKIMADAGGFISGHMRYISGAGGEDLRDRREYMLELLACGVLWNRYGAPPFTLDGLNRLITRLSATGEFEQEVKRLANWSRYLASVPEADAIACLTEAHKLAVWFAAYSADVLGEYTRNVDAFIAQEASKRPGRADYILRNRDRTEYHLNMISAEVMNEAFRAAFLSTDRRAVLVPGCMRRPATGRCAAVRVGSCLRCVECSAGCPIGGLRRHYGKQDIDIFVITHASEIPETIDRRTGVVGVACVLHLMSGGWKLRELGVPAQCVLLNFCGCQEHWNADQPAEIDETELAAILQRRTHAPS